MATPNIVAIPLASLPGGAGAWTTNSGRHLDDILTHTNIGQIAALYIQGSDQLDPTQPNVNLSFTDTLSDSDNTALLALAQHANDYMAIFVDGVLTDVGVSAPPFPEVKKVIGQLSSSSIQLQLKDGSGANIVADGVGAQLSVAIAGYMMCATPSPVTFDNTGQYTFTTGAEMNRIGTAEIDIQCGTLAARAIEITFTGS